ncbi:unnamed protein product, partial [Closterium sp. NIES-65]
MASAFNAYKHDKALQAAHQKQLKALLREPGNESCADCGGRFPRFASVSLGVFLCNRCYGIHRGIGVHVTRTKCVELDAWSPREVAAMRALGNRRAAAIWHDLFMLPFPPVFSSPPLFLSPSLPPVSSPPRSSFSCTLVRNLHHFLPISAALWSLPPLPPLVSLSAPLLPTFSHTTRAESTRHPANQGKSPHMSVNKCLVVHRTSPLAAAATPPLLHAPCHLERQRTHHMSASGFVGGSSTVLSILPLYPSPTTRTVPVGVRAATWVSQLPLRIFQCPYATPTPPPLDAGSLPAGVRAPTSALSDAEVERWIRDKYERRLYYNPAAAAAATSATPAPSPPAASPVTASPPSTTPSTPCPAFPHGPAASTPHCSPACPPQPTSTPPPTVVVPPRAVSASSTGGTAHARQGVDALSSARLRHPPPATTAGCAAHHEQHTLTAAGVPAGQTSHAAGVGSGSSGISNVLSVSGAGSSSMDLGPRKQAAAPPDLIDFSQ